MDYYEKDTLLRQKLFGRRNANCLNVQTHGCDYNGETGFVGQTIRQIRELKNELGIQKVEVASLKTCISLLIDDIGKLKKKKKEKK